MWPMVWIYQIVTGVTSVVGVPSTHLVFFCSIIFSSFHHYRHQVYILLIMDIIDKCLNITPAATRFNFMYIHIMHVYRKSPIGSGNGCRYKYDAIWFLTFYVSTFRRRRHYVFELPIRPSVRSPKYMYPLYTCTWVRWSIRPTVTVLRHFRPSVRPEMFPGIWRKTHGGNGLKFCVLMYLDHLETWLDYVYGLLIFLLLAPLWLSKTGQIWGFRAFPKECTGE